MKRYLAILLAAVALAIVAVPVAVADGGPSAQASAQKGPPYVVGMKLPEAEATLRARGWIPRPFNTDTLFGIIVRRHYTVCKQYRPIGKRVRLLAQKYGC